MKDCVTVAVGDTISHEHALARPDSACIRCSFFVGVALAGTGVGVPLSSTDSKMYCATATTLAARATIEAAVMVAV